jgi:lipopolysaccharide export system protein LptA
MMKNLHRFGAGAAGLAALALALHCPCALAERADRDKPTNIEYDHASIDDLKQVQVFTGNVVLTKGTIIIRCDELTVHQDPEGYQFAVAVAQPGHQAYFRQKREGYADQFIEGQADRIEYDGKADRAKLFTHAVVRKLEGASPADEMHGNTIEYNSDTEQYFVEGGGTPQTGVIDTRARTILQPAKHPTDPATTPAPAPMDLKAAPELKNKPNE